MTEKIIGILGGMGPEATADLFHRIIRATDVNEDQEHPRVVIYSNPKVPDRTAAILGEGPSPVSEMLMAAKKLEDAGADFIVIPCNTAHFFIGELEEDLRIPILNMIRLSVDVIVERFPRMKKAGLIATIGTIRSKIYREFLSDKGIELITPTKPSQKKVMNAIYGHLKKGDLEKGKESIMKVAMELIQGGAQIIINGCTEVSLVLKNEDLAVPVFDPLQVLALKAVEAALGKTKVVSNIKI